MLPDRLPTGRGRGWLGPRHVAGIRGQLTRPGAITIYSPDKGRLGLEEGISEVAEIGDQRVQLAGVMYEGGRQIGMMPGVYCSLRTARRLLPGLGPDKRCT